MNIAFWLIGLVGTAAVGVAILPVFAMIVINSVLGNSLSRAFRLKQEKSDKYVVPVFFVLIATFIGGVIGLTKTWPF